MAEDVAPTVPTRAVNTFWIHHRYSYVMRVYVPDRKEAWPRSGEQVATVSPTYTYHMARIEFWYGLKRNPNQLQ